MKITFDYDKTKDIWCLLNKGKNSTHSQNATKQYVQLVEKYGDSPSSKQVGEFIDTYLLDKNAPIEKYIDLYQKDWDIVSDEYHRRAQEIFKTTLPKEIRAYLTINSRCPYRIQENYFFVTVPTYDYVARRTVMHELWHFYTWYGLGADQIKKLGPEEYEELKEALTVLLNVKCKDLLPEGQEDTGYPQHKDVRSKILQFWEKDRDMNRLWEYLVE